MSNLDSGSGVQTASVTLRRVVRNARNGVRVEQTEVDVTGCVPLDYCARTLHVANVVPRLIADGVFAADGLPFEHYMEWGYFALVKGANHGADVVVTPLGQVWFGKRYHKAQ